jgi:hypothetical protein
MKSRRFVCRESSILSGDRDSVEASADFILSTAPPRSPYCLPRRGNRGLMQHRKVPALIASLSISLVIE